ncbi:MAG: Gfo/Idh/MocA family protein [Vicinamibacteria bacterium]
MKLRLAVVGLGGIAWKAYLPALAERDDLELLACGRSAPSVERVRDRYRVARATADIEELLSWQPRAAVVLTPSPTHRAIVERLLEAGVDVLVEKPATMSSGETQALTELAEARGRVFMAAFNRRFAPLHRRAREVWGGRTVGVGLFQKHRSGAAHQDVFSNYIDDTIHLIDLLRFFCGEARAVTTVERMQDGRLVGATSLVALERGGHASVVTSLEAARWEERVSLHGEGASLELDAFAELRWMGGADEQVRREEYASGWKSTLEGRGFPQQIGHFLDCVASRQTPLTSGREAVRTQRLLEDMVAARL